MKGNNGRAARRKLYQRLGKVLGSFMLMLLILHGLILHRFHHASAVSEAHSDEEHSNHHASGGLFGLEKSIRKGVRRGKQNILGTRYISEQDPASDPAWQDILHARVHLVDLVVNSNEVSMLASDEDDRYGGVYGVFCKIEWSRHKQDPSTVPMFRDLVEKSPDCEDNRIKVDLTVVVDRLREFRQSNIQTAAHDLDLGAVVFHESRCGSTLVANLLASMNPAQHRVYSESPPPITALKSVCGEVYEHCSLPTAAHVLQDVIHLMSRSDDPAETTVFFKIQSAGSRNIPVFLRAFPDTPWMFVYREPVQVMMSHLPSQHNKHIRQSNCVRQQYHSPPSAVVELLRHHHPGTHVRKVAPTEYCAAHLASITETAVTALHDSSTGTPINYRDLPSIVWEHILPHHLPQLTVGPAEIHRMQVTAGQYSKGRDHQPKRGAFQQDSSQKEAAASPEIRAAAEAILGESYQSLEEAAALMREAEQ